LIRHGLTLLSALLIGAVALPARAGAQSENGPRIEIELPSATSSMTVRMRNAIDGGRFEELLRNGFDVRVRMRAELWKSGRIFNSIVARQEWDVIVHFDQFDQTFDVALIDQNMNVTPLGTYRRLVDAKAALALPYSPPIGRPGPGEEHYYSVQADISTLDLNDLDEVSAWLRGELAPAVQGRRNPGTALGRGVRTLLSRVMGGEVRRLEARSPRFRVTPGG
jgi:hypothetical protein